MTKFKNINALGFTLTEVMIVVAIVGIGAALAIPSYNDAVQKSRRADVMEALLDCAAVQARNFSDSSPVTYLTNPQILATSVGAAADGRPVGGLCNGLVSKDRYYNLVVANPGNCSEEIDDNDFFWCFVITATAEPTLSQSTDFACATWTIDHRGRQTALDADDVDRTDICWKR